MNGADVQKDRIDRQRDKKQRWEGEKQSGH